MKHYDYIAIGTGSALTVVQGLLSEDPEAQVAVVDKDEPGGLCLTRACIPSKLLVYPAEVVRQVQEAGEHGIQVEITGVDFQGIMARMRSTVSEESKAIGQSLSASENIAYYRQAAEFTSPSSMRVGSEEISADTILLCSGSRPFIPDIPGLEKVPYLTSDTVLGLQDLPENLIILVGGYVAAEYGHFFFSHGEQGDHPGPKSTVPSPGRTGSLSCSRTKDGRALCGRSGSTRRSTRPDYGEHSYPGHWS